MSLSGRLSDFVIEYMQPRTKRIPALNIEHAARLAKVMAETDKVVLVSVIPWETWMTEQEEKQKGAT